MYENGENCGLEILCDYQFYLEKLPQMNEQGMKWLSIAHQSTA